MAYQVVHTFTIDTCQYDVLVDFENQLVQCVSSCFTPATVTEEQLGLAEDQEYAYTCISPHTLVQAFSQFAAPFVYLVVTPKSTLCEYRPPSCNFTFDVTTSNATNGDNNGSITVGNISPAGTYQFSLDNTIWQSSPVFNFLFPGTYNVYVRRDDGCMQNTLTVISNVTTPIVIPPGVIPYQLSNRLCFFFRLIIDGVTHTIHEPLKWDQVLIMGERDEEFHGYQFRYSEGEFLLGFDCDSGRELIEAEYNLHGQDGNVSFHFGYLYEGVDYFLFRGSIMLNTFKWYPEKIECTIVSDDVDTVYTSRLETKVDMTATESFDGDAVPTPTPYNIQLHPKIILTKIYEDTLFKQTTQTLSGPGLGGVLHYYILPDNTNVTFNETLDNYQYPLGVQVGSPVTLDQYLILFANDGEATFNIDINFLLGVHLVPVRSPTAYTAFAYLVKKKYNVATGVFDTTEIDITNPAVSGNFATVGSESFAQFNVLGQYTGTDTFLAGDSVYVYLKINVPQYPFAGAGATFDMLQSRFLWDVEYLEQTATTPANGWFLQDVIRHCLNVISNNHYAFKSEFLQLANTIFPFTDGCGSKYLITNGFQIRQFDVTNKPLKIDLKTVLKSVNALFCIGYNYQNNDNSSYIQIERRDFFYKEREILAIEDLEDYREEVAIDLIYNELEHGYSKYQDSGFNSLDEFNTKGQWLTPIRKNKKKLLQLSDFIASGYSLESIRRNQFAENPSSSVTNDEEPFIISVKRENATDFVTEKDEAFEVVTGIISPETSYNLRISPTRLLYNWLIWLKGIFAYKTSDDTIKNTFTTQNNDLITRFDTAETCRVGDENRSIIEETAAIRMAELQSTRDIYRPERVFIKCRLNPVQVQTINLAMTGRYGEEKDYGYIIVQKPTGQWQAFWLQKLSYNFATEKAELSGLALFDSPSLPESGSCCRWLAVNDCYLLVNGQKIVA